MGRKILIIDDDPDVCLIIKDFLEKEECTVYTAKNGEEGLKAAHHDKPDLILLDIIMPRVDGFQVLEKLKENKKTLSMPVVMLTARSDDEAKLTTASAYSEDYLIKPVKLKDLKSKIDEVLNRRG